MTSVVRATIENSTRTLEALGEGPSSHVELLAMSRDVRRAAIEGDANQLHLALCRLRNALVVHVRAESPRVSAIGEISRHVVVDGQRQLVNLIDDLLSNADDDDTAGCPCMRRSVELTHMLVRQARLENSMASRRPL